MTTAITLLLNLISSVITWFFTLNFDGVYIGWIFFTGIIMGLLIKFFLQNRGSDNG